MASASVAAEPLWKYGARPAKPRRIGPLILPTWSNLPSIKACPRSLVVLQLFVRRPVVASFLHTVISGKKLKSRPPRLTLRLVGLGSPVPMFKGVGNE